MTQRPFELEICANSVQSCLEAQKGGADRVELCAGIPEGGTTPSYGSIALARELLTIKLHVIIRPRGGDFLYSQLEERMMLEDIKRARELGADGVVIGCLNSQGDVDIPRCKKLISEAESMNVTFHRAFDVCRDPYETLEQIIELGCSRILTSGQEATAELGIPLLKELEQQAKGRIAIMAGCGVNAQNIIKIAENTGIKQFHQSARSTINSNMKFRNQKVSMGGTVTIDEFSKDETDAKKVNQSIELLNSYFL